MASNKNATNEHDDETSLLEALGSTVANVDTYESSVLRQATLDSAPLLTGAGFPNLQALAPSFDARRGQLVGSADAQHAQTLLSRVRNELSRLPDVETHCRLVLQTKEQMLLVYLNQVAGMSRDDLPVDPLREASVELKRSQRLLEKDTEKPTTETITKMDGTVARSVASSSATASFGKQALLERQERPTKRGRRTTIMGRKRNQTVEPNEQDEERKEQLRQIRKERQEQRRRRRQEWEDESEEEQEFLFQDKHPNDGPTPEDATAMDNDSKDATTKPFTTFVTCPICEEQVQGGDTLEETDARLSRHMQECQQGGRRTRQGSRGQTKSGVNESISTVATQPRRRNIPKKRSTKPRKARTQPVRTWKDSVDDYQEWDYEDRVDDWIVHGRNNMREIAERDQSEVPPGTEEYDEGLVIPGWVNNRLFPYQRTGLRWMWDLHLQEAGGVVGDDMGLGKTVQLSAYLGAMAGSRKLKSILIIAPATMLQHWLSELSIWAPGLRRILIHKSGESDGSSRSISLNLLRSLDKWLRTARANRVNEAIDEEDFDNFDEDSFCGTGYVVVTTYESIRRSSDIWTGHDWSYVVMDEGQKIRNPDADVTIACKRMRTPHRLLLSGTPIQNDLRELWSLFDFVFPGRLGTLPAFESEFADPIKRGGYSNASPMQVQLAYRCALMLRDLINPYLLRRQKKDIKEVSRYVCLGSLLYLLSFQTSHRNTFLEIITTVCLERRNKYCSVDLVADSELYTRLLFAQTLSSASYVARRSCLEQSRLFVKSAIIPILYADRTNHLLTLLFAMDSLETTRCWVTHLMRMRTW